MSSSTTPSIMAEASELVLTISKVPAFLAAEAREERARAAVAKEMAFLASEARLEDGRGCFIMM